MDQSSSSHPQSSRGGGGGGGGAAGGAPAVYDTTHGGHYGASAALANSGFAPAELYTGPWANVHQGLHGQYKDILTTYWQQTINHLESDQHDYKLHQLPLARIKKVMKADPEVKMISAEAPILFAKGCDIFITELTMRAWIHAEENKRRTLQRSDIASALAKSDMFDFLIDIVPREESTKRPNPTGQSQSGQGAPSAAPGQQMPGQHGMPGAANHMAPAGYMGEHAIAPDQQYREPPPMYANPVQAGPGAPYGQQPPQAMYGDMEGTPDNRGNQGVQQQQDDAQGTFEEGFERVVGSVLPSVEHGKEMQTEEAPEAAKRAESAPFLTTPKSEEMRRTLDDFDFLDLLDPDFDFLGPALRKPEGANGDARKQ
ncbi:Uu.00g002190.m01.CDS01 [Anthostomella pinea]|uniref:Uu.00g002190.m01.CDS01 n=1 Tax=Anthostomella pinea TaxID=933095 RepID=A0AAI8YG64_9PEZI|nr:Uu.00g002190.m01.CDS01 [Anthostomella pinea]